MGRICCLVAALVLAAAAPAVLARDDTWQQASATTRDGPEADLVVQVGDIDNLGFGWPEGFTPFSGRSTPSHGFPFQPEADDPSGTDRIMVVSGYGAGAGARDGYTYSTSRPANAPQPLVMAFELQDLEVKAAALQLFVDDFQSQRMGSRYRAWLDGRETTDLPVVTTMPAGTCSSSKRPWSSVTACRTLAADTSTPARGLPDPASTAVPRTVPV